MFNLGTKKPRFVIGSHDPSQGELLAALVESADAAVDAWVIEQPNAVEAIFSLGPLIRAAIGSDMGGDSDESAVIREVQALLGRYMRYNKVGSHGLANVYFLFPLRSPHAVGSYHKLYTIWLQSL